MRGRTTAILALATLLVGAFAAAPTAAGDDDAAPAKGAGAMPTALPDDAELPPPTVFQPVRPDVFVGRTVALDRIISCTQCQGKGAKVTRHRQPAKMFDKPDVTETVEDCPGCKGTGITENPARVAPVVDALVSQLGRLPADLPSSPKLFGKARATLTRLGASGELAVKVTAEDRNELLAERLVKAGTTVTVTGVAGRPFGSAGSRVIPVLVDGRALVLVRAPVINFAPEKGNVLVGGVLAGEVKDADLGFGRTIVLDGGFAVPHVDPPVIGPSADPAKAGAGDSGARPGAPSGRGK